MKHEYILEDTKRPNVCYDHVEYHNPVSKWGRVKDRGGMSWIVVDVSHDENGSCLHVAGRTA